VIRAVAMLCIVVAPVLSHAQSTRPSDASALVLRAGPVRISVPDGQGWALASQEVMSSAAMRSPREGHSLDLSVYLHSVADPWSVILLAKQPRVAVEPYLAVLRDDLDAPEMPEVYFEAIPMRLANRHCLFFQSISDEEESVFPQSGTRVLRSIGAFCALPDHEAVIELRLIGIQPSPTDNYDAFSADMEAVFETLAID
jgi:hypothetical protein